jgi:hypothetical protein
MKRRIHAVVALLALALSGCAAAPVRRAPYSDLPALENGWSRLYISAGTSFGVKLWSVHQVGPVYINNQRVGSTAKDEHFVVDVRPGTYEMSCTPEEPYKNFTEKRQLQFGAAETHYLVCDMEQKGAGMYFGAVGVLASEYVTKTVLKESPLESGSKLVAYSKIQ